MRLLLCAVGLVALAGCKEAKGTCLYESQNISEWCVVDMPQDDCAFHAGEDLRPGKKNHPDWIKEDSVAGTARCTASGYGKLPPGQVAGPDTYVKDIVGTCVGPLSCLVNTSTGAVCEGRPNYAWTPHDTVEHGIARCTAAGMTETTSSAAEIAAASSTHTKLTFTLPSK